MAVNGRIKETSAGDRAWGVPLWVVLLGGALAAIGERALGFSEPLLRSANSSWAIGANLLIIAAGASEASGYTGALAARRDRAPLLAAPLRTLWYASAAAILGVGAVAAVGLVS